MSHKVSGREFNQDVSKAKKAALSGPVFITDCGEIRHVLLSIEEYNKIRRSKNIVDLLAMDEAEEIDFSPEKFTGEADELIRPEDFS